VPPRSRSGHPVDRGGPRIEVEKDGRLLLDGELVRDPAALTDELRISLLTRDDPGAAAPPIYVRADGRTSAAALGRIEAAIPAGFTVRRLLVEAPDPRRVPSPAQGVVQPRTSATVLTYSEAMRRGLSGPGCLPIMRFFAHAAEGDQGDRGARGIPAALRECHCQVPDLDLAETALLQLYGAFERPLRWLPLPAAATLIRARGTVADLVAASR
jgi:hypothetical protein